LPSLPLHRSLAGKLALAGASVAFVVASLGLLELTVRAWEPDYLLRTRGPHVSSESYGWRGRAGASMVLEGAKVALNAHGYRGRELRPRRPAGSRRVLVIGDSIAFGLGVADDETFAHLLDARTNGFEVANLGVMGYGPEQELLVLLNEGLPQLPDVVVLAVCLGNDFADVALPVSLYDGQARKPRFRIEGQVAVLDGLPLPQGAPARALRWLGDYSHLFNRVANVATRSVPADAWHGRYADAVSDEDRVLKLVSAIVVAMDAACRRQGVSFLVAAFPDRGSFSDTPHLVARFYQTLASKGITVIDVAARFRADGMRLEDVALDGIAHLNPAGHRIVAALLEEEILRAGRTGGSQVPRED
jgi:hypothetical protein